MIFFGRFQRIEKRIFLFIWTASVLYAIYCFARITQNFFSKYVDDFDDFEEGWIILDSRRKDKADFEWETISFLIKTTFMHTSIYLIISEFLRASHVSSKSLQYYQISFPVIYLCFWMGYLLTSILLLQPLAFIIVGSFHSKICVWVCNMTFIVLIAVAKKMISEEVFLTAFGINQYKAYIIIMIVCWMNLRCTSYYLLVSKKDVTNFLAYCLYFPTICTGPFLEFKHFQNIYCKDEFSPIKVRVKRLIFNILRCLLWFTFGQISLHYVYVNAASFQPELVRKFDMWTLCGYGYAMGQFFHLKYVVLYGLSTSIASFENIVVPNLPRCIGRIHLYSDMWKYFDPGLYSFLKLCIYIPSRSSLHMNKCLSSMLCFLFVFIWHGIAYQIFIWVVLNFIGINLEFIANTLYETYFKDVTLVKNLGPNRLQMVKNFLASLLLAMSAMSNFYFFAGVEIGHIFIQKFLTEHFFNKIMLFVVLFCCCEVSVEIRDIKARSA